MNFMTGTGLVPLKNMKGLTLKGTIEALNHIPRFCGRGEYGFTIAEHSMITLAIAKKVYGTKNPGLLLAVLTHDFPEAVTNDIPSYVKRYLELKTPGALKGLTEIEDNVLRKFGLLRLHRKHKDAIKYCDQVALVFEASQEFPDQFNPDDWGGLPGAMRMEQAPDFVSNPWNHGNLSAAYDSLKRKWKHG